MILTTPIACAGEVKLREVPLLQLGEPASVMTTPESDGSTELGIKLTDIVTPVYPAATALNAKTGAFCPIKPFTIATNEPIELEI